MIPGESGFCRWEKLMQGRLAWIRLKLQFASQRQILSFGARICLHLLFEGVACDWLVTGGKNFAFVGELNQCKAALAEQD